MLKRNPRRLPYLRQAADMKIPIAPTTMRLYPVNREISVKPTWNSSRRMKADEERRGPMEPTTRIVQ
jgi:hypothetical protein